MPAALTPDQLARDLAIRDLTDPAMGRHAMQLLVDQAIGALASTWGCKVRITRGPRAVPLAHNYDRLGYPSETVTRDARYTRYVDDERVLRSHTSSMIPTALDELAADPSANPARDVLLACPGIVYRRDAIDRLHTGTPHQLDLWRITRRRLHDEDLEQMVSLLVGALCPGRTWRWERRVHPYTVRGRQVDVRWDDEWIEICECGLAHPDVLGGAGLGGWSGLALGMGLDRLLMLRKDIPDIRLLRSTDDRIAGQLLDLEPYRPVSALPAVSRDLSIAVAADDDVETLGDRVRDALGPEADLVESVTVLSETSYERLPNAARTRLGMGPEHKNVLVRLAIRPYDRTLTDAEANVVRDRVYTAVHRGSSGQWVTDGTRAAMGSESSERLTT